MWAQRRICTLCSSKEDAALEAKLGHAVLAEVGIEVYERGAQQGAGCLFTPSPSSFGPTPLQDVRTLDPALTRLHIPLTKDVDPDDTYCSSPYMKGFAFLAMLSTHVGGPDVFDEFLKVGQ